MRHRPGRRVAAGGALQLVHAMTGGLSTRRTRELLQLLQRQSALVARQTREAGSQRVSLPGAAALPTPDSGDLLQRSARSLMR